MRVEVWQSPSLPVACTVNGPHVPDSSAGIPWAMLISEPSVQNPLQVAGGKELVSSKTVQVYVSSSPGQTALPSSTEEVKDGQEETDRHRKCNQNTCLTHLPDDILKNTVTR